MHKRKYKKNGKEYSYTTLYLNGLAEDVLTDLHNIAKNLGHVTVTGLIKPVLRELRDRYPESMRQDPNSI